MLVLGIHSQTCIQPVYVCGALWGVQWATETVQDRFPERVLGTRVPESPGHKLAKLPGSCSPSGDAEHSRVLLLLPRETMSC